MSGIQGAFGFMRGAAAGYAYVAMGDNNSGTILQTTAYGASGTGTRWTGISPQSTGGSSQGVIGVVADGQFIANCQYYTINNGTSWTAWGSAGSVRFFPPGPNGAIAYSTTSRRAFSFTLSAIPKAGGIYCFPVTVSRTGSVITSTSFLTSSAASGSNVTWSPAFDYFYYNAYGSSTNQYRYFNAASPSTGASITIGNANNYKPGISSDGYPLLPVFTGGVSYELRKYTAADLSTYTNLGAISDGYYAQTTHSPWIFYTVNNKYLVAAGTSSQIFIREATSANPQNLTLLASISTGTVSLQSVSITEEAITGRLLIGGIATYSVPKGGTIQFPYTYLSVDGGTTWTNYNQAALGASKNFA